MTTTEPALSREDRAVRLLAIAVVEERIRAEKAALRTDTLGDLAVGERIAGVLDPDDRERTSLGFVQKRKGSESARVVDEAAFRAWVREHAPTELVTVEQVRPAFTARVLDSVKKDGVWVDPATSEAMDVDGVEVATASPTLMVKASEQADRLVAEALAGRRLELLGPS